MDYAIVKDALIDILKRYQEAFGHECPNLEDSDVPTEALVGFDSKLWAPAKVELAEKLGVELPVELELFKDLKQDKGRSIRQIIEQVIGAAIAKPNEVSA